MLIYQLCFSGFFLDWGICPHMRRASAGDKVLMRAGIMKGDRDYGGPKFDRLYHNLKVLLLL